MAGRIKCPCQLFELRLVQNLECCLPCRNATGLGTAALACELIDNQSFVKVLNTSNFRILGSFQIFGAVAGCLAGAPILKGNRVALTPSAILTWN